jgi:hypothetical protein
LDFYLLSPSLDKDGGLAIQRLRVRAPPEMLSFFAFICDSTFRIGGVLRIRFGERVEVW